MGVVEGAYGIALSSFFPPLPRLAAVLTGCRTKVEGDRCKGVWHVWFVDVSGMTSKRGLGCCGEGGVRYEEN